MRLLHHPVLVAALLGICSLLAAMAHYYRSNAISYKAQRDESALALKKASGMITEMQARQRDIESLDARYTRELADAKAKNNVLQRRLDAGGRVRIQGTCTAPASAPTTSTGGVGDDASIELSELAGRNILRIRAGIISDQQKVKYLQEYVRSQCRH
ncbi:lysis protein [Shimwellia blattae]|uniref:Putative Rz endopeptidase from lambdoid prophage n=1 Tax=Shimwellia blattae (strain ATCC 29907 / DSM 4481 / JCM 1650 / NBRC 105725 / CDC 9005-74) TaxID=630626 RepID=I2B9F3_SHIBC|nr:lysis protein [Shimwellia blattae]AFJ47157.1 putative Rz endopeptidase from lambdoid prophage [Shimwellia blattae DSM 4481 = NBRC 105725]VDY64649.1 Bacteriophage lysis protein [Shimwellia blattae]VEC22756.1 Bacteriophage lysis protein [Shimwellia blattae]